MAMIKGSLAIMLAASSVLLSGCVNPDGSANNTGTGILAGGAFGALAGAAIGGPRHAGADALIGAAAGALAGGLVGNAADQEQAARLQAQAPETYARVGQGAPLSVADVKAMARAGISETVIINQINSSHTVFQLSTADIIDLRDAGVSDKVINYMINTPSTAGVAPPGAVPYVDQAPPPAPVETVAVAPGPDYIWIGGEWVWHGGWVWAGGHWDHPPYPHAVWVSGRCWHDGHGWHAQHGHWH